MGGRAGEAEEGIFPNGGTPLTNLHSHKQQQEILTSKSKSKSKDPNISKWRDASYRPQPPPTATHSETKWDKMYRHIDKYGLSPTQILRIGF